jgi:hypothetical protein
VIWLRELRDCRAGFERITCRRGAAITWLFPNVGNYAIGGDRGEKVPPAGAVHLDLRGRMVG